MNEFFQNPPQLSNTFESDQFLQSYLKKTLPVDSQKNIFQHLNHVGDLAAHQWLSWSEQAETQVPLHIPFDAWGNRIDHIQMSDGWKNLEAAAATEGIIATAYERKFQEYSRVYQMSLLYLFHSSSAFVSCPLAMTDGAAKTLEIFGTPEIKAKAVKNLTSRDPKYFWTSGQWMTEKTGGSDVGLSLTEAKLVQGSNYAINGVKWFTSATTSQMALTLARTSSAPGTKGLSLFYIELRNAQNKLQNIEILRLKNKLGTKALPTAELKLHGAPATLLGDEGNGVKKISSLLNITRIYNSICAISHMRRALDLAQDYSRKRKAFGDVLINLPLHKFTLDSLEKTFQTCFDLTFYVVGLLGKEEAGVANESEKILLRTLTPLVKLYTAKRCMQVVSEVIEVFGGAGYVEDTGLPKLLRDAQVFSIWEGTTNVLCLDFIRALEKDHGAGALVELFKLNDIKIKQSAEVKRKSEFVLGLLKDWDSQKAGLAEQAREFCFNAADVLGYLARN